MNKIPIIAEIGINYATGNDKSKFLENAKKLIDAAVLAGCDYVKFQKRNPFVCVPEDQKDKMKKVPWRDEECTYLQYKLDVEFGKREYKAIDKYCKSKGINWFVSVWDIDSVDFMTDLLDRPLVPILKIPSALINNIELCKYAREKAALLMVSTGMSTQEEIDECINACNPDFIFHTNSTYPSPIDELNLNYIQYLQEKYPHSIIGYSGHEFGLTTSFAAVAIGAKIIERHITLDRTSWGSDQFASVEPIGLIKLVKGIRDIELSTKMAKGPRVLLESELDKRKSLRGS